MALKTRKLAVSADIRALRLRRQMSRAVLARRMNTSESTVWKLENGVWGWQVLERACIALYATIDISVKG